MEMSLKNTTHRPNCGLLPWLKKKAEGMANKKPEEKTNNKLLSRPQFLEFLIRLAIEKWCSFNPNQKKKPFVDQ
mgnify:CR=1 FL=1